MDSLFGRPRPPRKAPRRIRTTVDWWSDEHGWGALCGSEETPGGVFVHHSTIEMAGYRTLRPGREVVAVVAGPLRHDQDGYRYSAVTVSPLSPPDAAGEAPVDSAAVQTNRSAPPATVAPVLFYPDVRAAVAWLEHAFGFEERVRVGEAHRAQLRVGADGAVVVAEARGEQVAPSADVVTHVVKVRVADVDSAFARAREAGARILEVPTTHVYGERSCLVGDLAGHRWELTQTVRDVEPEAWGGVTVAPW